MRLIAVVALIVPTSTSATISSFTIDGYHILIFLAELPALDCFQEIPFWIISCSHLIYSFTLSQGQTINMQRISPVHTRRLLHAINFHPMHDVSKAKCR
jgi:hypothetical protein